MKIVYFDLDGTLFEAPADLQAIRRTNNLDDFSDFYSIGLTKESIELAVPNTRTLHFLNTAANEYVTLAFLTARPLEEATRGAVRRWLTRRAEAGQLSVDALAAFDEDESVCVWDEKYDDRWAGLDTPARKAAVLRSAVKKGWSSVKLLDDCDKNLVAARFVEGVDVIDAKEL